MTEIELYGYFATALTISSFLFKKMETLRFVNSLGAFAWVGYALAIKSTPLIIVNAIIIAIHINWFFLQKKVYNRICAYLCKTGN